MKCILIWQLKEHLGNWNTKKRQQTTYGISLKLISFASFSANWPAKQTQYMYIDPWDKWKAMTQYHACNLTGSRQHGLDGSRGESVFALDDEHVAVGREQPHVHGLGSLQTAILGVDLLELHGLSHLWRFSTRTKKCANFSFFIQLQKKN